MRWGRWLVAGTVAAGLLWPAAQAFAESQSKTVQVSATILPRLELSVEPDTGQDISFGVFDQPAEGSAVSRSVRVSVNVFSNLGGAYHVTQMVRRPLATPEGAAMREEQFLVQTSEASRGTLGAPVAAPILIGHPATLYTSDERGKSDRFFADYTLLVTPETPPGEFATEIVYTVTSL